jgi:hypothetical protein
MALIVEKCMKNWLATAITATKDPLKVGRMLTLSEFIKYTDFTVDKFSMDKFYYNLDNEIPLYIDNSIIEWFGYSGKIVEQKKQIRRILQNNFAEYENIYWFEYSNKEYVTFYSKNPIGVEPPIEIYPNPTEFKGKNKTKHMVIHPIIFKHIVLMADTQNSMKIRDYYITLEDLIKKYTQYQSEAIKIEKDSKINNLSKKIDELMNYTKKMHESNDKLHIKFDEESKKLHIKLDEESKKSASLHIKLDKVLPQRVDLEISDPDYPHVYIIRDCDADEGEHDLYAMRCQASNYNNQLRRLKSKYGENLRRVLTIKQPNAVVFWKSIKKELHDNLVCDKKTNWFSLTNLSKIQFKRKIMELNALRLNA